MKRQYLPATEFSNGVSVEMKCELQMICERCGYVLLEKKLFCPKCKRITLAAYPWRAFLLIVGVNALAILCLVYMRLEWGPRFDRDLALIACFALNVLCWIRLFRAAKSVRYKCGDQEGLAKKR